MMWFFDVNAIGKVTWFVEHCLNVDGEVVLLTGLVLKRSDCSDL